MDENRRDMGAQLRELSRILRERKWLIVVCALLTTGAALAYSLLTTPVYEATARLLVRQGDLGGALGIGDTQSTDPLREAATDLELVTQPALAARVVRDLELSLTPEELLGKVSASAEGNSSLIAIGVTDASAATAARIANSYASEYVAFRRESDRRRVQRALAGARRQAAAAAGRGASAPRVGRLRDQVQDLELLESLQTGNSEVIQRAREPGSPASPKTVRNVVLGLVFGLLLGAGLALLREKLDRRVKREEDISALLPEVPIIAAVPATNQKRHERALEVEGFRTLQTNVGFLEANGSLRSLLVTSPMVGDGKSTTSLNLALAMAERDESVILVEADLRRSGLSDRLGLNGHAGLSNVLSGGGRMEEYLEDLSINGSMLGRQAHRLGPDAALSGIVTMLPAGPAPPNPARLLSGPPLEQLLSQAKTSADRVIVDGAPVGPVSDMLPVLKHVDGVVIVLRLNYSRRDQIQRLLYQLERAKVRPIGIVLLDASSSRSDYAYLPA